MMEAVHSLPADLHQRLKTNLRKRTGDNIARWRDRGEMKNSFSNLRIVRTIENCIADFIDATSNDGVRQRVCIVCARENVAKRTMSMQVQDIPNRHLLVPVKLHSAQKLTFGIAVGDKCD